MVGKANNRWDKRRKEPKFGLEYLNLSKKFAWVDRI